MIFKSAPAWTVQTQFPGGDEDTEVNLPGTLHFASSDLHVMDARGQQSSHATCPKLEQKRLHPDNRLVNFSLVFFSLVLNTELTVKLTDKVEKLATPPPHYTQLCEQLDIQW